MMVLIFLSVFLPLHSSSTPFHYALDCSLAMVIWVEFLRVGNVYVNFVMSWDKVHLNFLCSSNRYMIIKALPSSFGPRCRVQYLICLKVPPLSPETNFAQRYVVDGLLGKDRLSNWNNFLSAMKTATEWNLIKFPCATIYTVSNEVLVY